jgi:hypothetical protein
LPRLLDTFAYGRSGLDVKKGERDSSGAWYESVAIAVNCERSNAFQLVHQTPSACATDRA